MMDDMLTRAFMIGAERVAAWADLLDRINVFPVADGDTGRNMKVSLSPLRDLNRDRDGAIRGLLMNARGNSGNIAARFFSGFLRADSAASLPAAARNGRDLAWKAVREPRQGTMLTVFDALAQALEDAPGGAAASPDSVIGSLERAVRSTPELLPKLKEAGVVDSGALGMYIYLEAFFLSLAGRTGDFRPVTAVFGDWLSVAPSFAAGQDPEEGFCLDITLDAKNGHDSAAPLLAELGESVVVLPGDGFVKVHLHTEDTAAVRARLRSIGGIINWSDDDLNEQVREFARPRPEQAIHVMTDAAGSVTRGDAIRLGFTLLDSYVTVEDTAAPETSVKPDEVYAAMRRGVRASTSQASEFERHELYRSALSLHPRLLYLCVGSAYTGNYEVAQTWKSANDPDGRMTILDTGAASGRLGAMALAVADLSNRSKNPESVIDYARRAIDRCREYIFIDNLKYLAAGGRVSRTKAFFGNMLSMKPVVTPTADGVVSAGIARTPEEQIAFALARLAEHAAAGARPFIMLQYTDNLTLVETRFLPEIAARHPGADIRVQPLSLTTGVHVGPGAWSMAFIPEE